MNDDSYLILASNSPRRKNLLESMGLPFSAVASEIEERKLPGETPEAFVKRVSLEKAVHVSRLYGDRWVLGADTVVVLKSAIMGKPRDERDAVDMLVSLAGRTHLVCTGVSLVNKSLDYSQTFCELTKVTFRSFDREEAEAYVLTGEPMDKAGAYGAQAMGAALIKRVEGSYTNVIGLPLTLVLDMLKEAGVIDVSTSRGRMYDVRKSLPPGRFSQSVSVRRRKEGTPPTLEEIQEAAKRIGPYIQRTSVMTSRGLNDALDVQCYFKCENLQKTGSFKFRGACNAVFSISKDRIAAGVATHSSGNHAAALALAARRRGTDAYIVMPYNAPAVKKVAVEGYGGKIHFCRPTQEAREKTLERLVKETGASFIHPYDDYRVIAGQGTAVLELLQEVGELDAVLTPVGGGGLLSGTALTLAAISPSTRVIAAEPEGADDAFRSLRAGKIIPSVNPQTIADGLLTSLGDLTFPIIREHVEQIVTVSDDAILKAMRLVWENLKIIIEPSAAVTVAVLQERKVDLSGKRVGIIISGGNVDLGKVSNYLSG
ncbi:MAG: pyridoxal-phosphate dependent enzyme [Pseudomonadota bacterium]